MLSDSYMLTSSDSHIQVTTEYPANGSFNRPSIRRAFAHAAGPADAGHYGNRKYGQASRLISIGKLNVSPRLHTRPITWSSSRSL